MNKKITNDEEKETQNVRQAAIERENKNPSNILRSLHKQKQIEGFKNKFNSLSNKDEVFAEFVCRSDDNSGDDLNAIKLLLTLGAKPSHYVCSVDVIIEYRKYKTLLILIQNQHYEFNKTWLIEFAAKNNLSSAYIQQLEQSGCSITQCNGSPLYFAVAQRNISLIKWLLDEKKVDIHASPSCYSDYPAIAACIEMLKERYRDWYADRNPIDTTPQRRRRNFGGSVEKNVADPMYWDLNTDEEWIELCNLLQLIVSYGGNPFKNYSNRRQFGSQGSSPRYSYTFNVTKFHKRCDLKLVEMALINGFREMIDRLGVLIQSVIDIQVDICNIIALLLIGEYYDQYEWEQMVDSPPVKFQKYVKMMKIGMPIHSIKNKMKRDGMADTEINNLTKQSSDKQEDMILVKDDDYPISTYSYNKVGDHFPCRTTGTKVKWDGPKR